MQTSETATLDRILAVHPSLAREDRPIANAPSPSAHDPAHDPAREPSTSQASADGAAADTVRFFEREGHKSGVITAAIDHALRAFRGGHEISAPDVEIESLKQRYVDFVIPAHGRAAHDYFEQLAAEVLPFAVNVASPYYIGHMTSALPSFMPELSRLLAEINQNVVKVETSKSLTFVERQVLGMVHRLFFGLPDEHYRAHVQDSGHSFGVFTAGGTTANITAMWYAFHRALMAQGFTKSEIAGHGTTAALSALGYKGAVIIGSPLMHYSFKKAASLLGIGENGLLFATQDRDRRLSLEGLESLVAECRRKRRLIVAIVGIAGATETGTIDPLGGMAEIAAANEVSLHVDAAWGGALAFSAQHRRKIAGIERADTIAFCPHKQLYLPQGVSLCLMRRTDRNCGVTTHAEYQARAGSFDLGQYTLEGSRPAVSLMLHAGLHLLGAAGYAWLVDQAIAKADVFCDLVERSGCFEIVGRPEMNIVNYRYVPERVRCRHRTYSIDENAIISAAVRTIQQRQFIKGDTFVSCTRFVHEAYCSEPIEVFRVVLSNPLTTPTHLQAVLDDQLAIAARFVEAPSDKATS